MPNLNHRAPRVFFRLSSLFCFDPVGCATNSHLTRLHAACYSNRNSQPKSGHTVTRLHSRAPNSQSVTVHFSVWRGNKVVTTGMNPEAKTMTSVKTMKAKSFTTYHRIYLCLCLFLWWHVNVYVKQREEEGVTKSQTDSSEAYAHYSLIWLSYVTFIA